MNEDIDFIIETTQETMGNAINHLDKKFVNIRAGKANPTMVNSVMVDYYGSQTPITQVANVNTPDAMTISIQPWEKNLIPEIEKGILLANLGFNPMNNGESIIISVPPLTEERRIELVKHAKTETEETKIGIRNDRKSANSNLKSLDLSEDLLKNAEIDIQDLTDTYIKKADDLFHIKEKEIMTV